MTEFFSSNLRVELNKLLRTSFDRNVNGLNGGLDVNDALLRDAEITTVKFKKGWKEIRKMIRSRS